ncbi:hypothetical protein PIB30_023514 [Stylosanthes scabra]|uniref:R13L1/DRL21-like LRR repeat region domain-containing protein n=1 Tax=Stylosanthes scabra TaxID=79078 RepID=A0ABU6T9T5_9FABA|nr:hypothetical protein [Stylosanthes scabra]
MSKLKDLQILSFYIVGKDEENGIGELGEPVNLRGSFRIEKLENVVKSGEAWKARMVDKKYISNLCLEWSSGEDSDTVDSQIEKDIPDKLKPANDLKDLTIKGYRGTMFPHWIGQSWYHKMTKLELSGCKNCWVLPPSLELSWRSCHSHNPSNNYQLKGGSVTTLQLPLFKQILVTRLLHNKILKKEFGDN